MQAREIWIIQAQLMLILKVKRKVSTGLESKRLITERMLLLALLSGLVQ